MRNIAPNRMTVTEFLEWDDGTDTRYELVDGIAVAMAPPAAIHSRIAGNLALALGSRLKAPCRVHVEQGVWRPDDDRHYFQADVAVVCGELKRGERSPDPVLVAEIVSDSSYDHDRGRKTEFYRRVDACLCILIVHTERRRVERWTRDGARWIVQDHIGEAGEVPADGVGVLLDLAEIYAGVEL